MPMVPLAGLCFAVACMGINAIEFAPSLGSDEHAWHVWGNAFVNAFTDHVGRSYLYHQIPQETFVGGSSFDTSSFDVFALTHQDSLSAKPFIAKRGKQINQTLRAVDGVSTTLDAGSIEVILDHAPSTRRPTAISSRVHVEGTPKIRGGATEGVFVVVYMQSLAPTPLATYTDTLELASLRFNASIVAEGNSVISRWEHRQWNGTKEELPPNELHLKEVFHRRHLPLPKDYKLQGAARVLPEPPLPVYMSVEGQNCKNGNMNDGQVQIFVADDIPEGIRAALPSQFSLPVAVFIPKGATCSVEMGVLADDHLPSLEKFTEIDPKSFSWSAKPFAFPAESPAALSEQWVTALHHEADWKLAQLSSWSTYRAALGTFAVPQGSAYEYSLAQFEPNTGDMLRDTGVIPVLAAAGLKTLARSTLENTMRIQQGHKEGQIPYSWYGENATAEPILGWLVHPDLDVHLFGAAHHAMEGKAIDCNWLLNSNISFLGGELPHSAKGSNSALAHLRVALSHFKHRVGLGPHGLVRSFWGDWSDNLVDNQAEGYDELRSETHMVSAAAVVVFREFSTSLAKMCPESSEVKELIGELLSYREKLQEPFADRSPKSAVWTTDGAVPHFRRAYLYKLLQKTPLDLGNQYVDLNAQLWPLLSVKEDGLISDDERVALLNYVRHSIDEPNALGASILPPGLPSYPGATSLTTFMELHSWARPIGLLIRAYVHNNKTDWAWDLVARASSTNHCHLFQDTPLGCVSGPDAVNAAGGAWDIALTTDMTKYPWANANPNAMWLWGVMALTDARKENLVAQIETPVLV